MTWLFLYPSIEFHVEDQSVAFSQSDRLLILLNTLVNRGQYLSRDRIIIFCMWGAGKLSVAFLAEWAEIWTRDPYLRNSTLHSVKLFFALEYHCWSYFVGWDWLKTCSPMNVAMCSLLQFLFKIICAHLLSHSPFPKICLGNYLWVLTVWFLVPEKFSVFFSEALF